MLGALRRRVLLFAVALLLTLGLSVAITITREADGLHGHLLYLPIVLGAFAFDLPGAIAIALAAAAGLAPAFFAPVPAATGQELEGSTLAAWLTRSGVLLGVGMLAGALAAAYRLKARRADERAQRYSLMCKQVLSSLANVVESRDAHAKGHCERVAQNAVVLGRALGFPSHDLDTLYWGALLHDLGKIRIADEILFKPGALSEEEYREIKQHATHGAELLESMAADFADIAQIVRFHHERWDGRGYPFGLRGETIPLMSRIVALVDVFEALTSERPYRKPLGAAEALAYVSREAGQHFDPHLVPLFERLHSQGQILHADQPVHAADASVDGRHASVLSELRPN